MLENVYFTSSAQVQFEKKRRMDSLTNSILNWYRMRIISIAAQSTMIVNCPLLLRADSNFDNSIKLVKSEAQLNRSCSEKKKGWIV